ncbi:hypothetical protein [Anaerolentibacter hominis]|uniref:NHL domain-containing protein n=1 Tax=Anaerolentibacter hominis TaxID=3079009 RepID=UPI0031B7FEBB
MKKQYRIAVIFLVLSMTAALLVPQNGRMAVSQKQSEDLLWLQENKILGEVFDTDKILANPSGTITRQEFLVLLLSAAGQKGTTAQFNKLTYTDKSKVKKSFRNYIAAAASLDILFESKDGKKKKIEPDKVLTKQIAAYYIGRLTGIEREADLSSYRDFASLSVKTRPYVSGLLAAGILKSESDEKLGPVKKVTWSYAASLIRSCAEAGHFEQPSPKVLAGGLPEGTKVNGLELKRPLGIARSSDGVIYLADTANGQIKQIKNGVLSVLAGRKTAADFNGGQLGGYVDGPCEEAVFSSPSSVRSVKGGVLAADSGNHAIRLISVGKNTVETYAGTGSAGMKNGRRQEAQFNNPQGMDVSKSGIVYIADTGNNCIRKIDKNGTVTTLAGMPGEGGYRDGKASEALFSSPMGVVCDGGILYVADSGNQRIRKIENGQVTTIAGSGDEKDAVGGFLGGFQDGEASKALFNGPVDVTVDEKGTLYIADSGNGMIRTVRDGMVSTLAGYGNPAYSRLSGWDDYLVNPAGLFVSTADGKLYVADSFKNHVICLNTKR